MFLLSVIISTCTHTDTHIDHKGFPMGLKTEFTMPKDDEEDEEELLKAKLYKYLLNDVDLC